MPLAADGNVRRPLFFGPPSECMRPPTPPPYFDAAAYAAMWPALPAAYTAPPADAAYAYHPAYLGDPYYQQQHAAYFQQHDAAAYYQGSHEAAAASAAYYAAHYAAANPTTAGASCHAGAHDAEPEAAPAE